MKTKLFIMLLIVLAMILVSCKQSDTTINSEISKSAAIEDVAFTVVFVIGDVTKRNSDSTVKVVPGEILRLHDTLLTGAKASVDISYRDLGIVRVAENSECSIHTLADSLGESTELKLEKGSVAATFGKLKKESFSVQTQTMVAAVRGTSFVVSTDGDKTVVSVAKGRVSVAPALAKDSVSADMDIAALALDVSSGEKAELSNNDLEQVKSGEKRITAESMTKSELEDTKREITSIKVEEAVELSPEVREEIVKEVPLAIDDSSERIRLEEEHKAEQERIEAEAVAENRRKIAIAAARQREKERQQELARQREFERQHELARQRELERQQELARQRELERQQELAKQEEAERQKQALAADNSDPGLQDQNTESNLIASAGNVVNELDQALEKVTEIEIDPNNVRASDEILAKTEGEVRQKNAKAAKVERNKPIKIKAIDFSSKNGVALSWDEAILSYVVTSNDRGDWIEYKVDIPEDGDYIITYNLSSHMWQGEIELVSGESKQRIKIPMSSSGGSKVPINRDCFMKLQKGEQTLRISVVEGGEFTVNYIVISKGKPFTVDDFLNLFKGKK